MPGLRVRLRDDHDTVEAFIAERNALRFYQRRAHLKPEIPRIGDHGIDLRDELELEKVLGA